MDSVDCAPVGHLASNRESSSMRDTQGGLMKSIFFPPLPAAAGANFPLARRALGVTDPVLQGKSPAGLFGKFDQGNGVC